MQSYLTIDKGKAETVLFKMGLCLCLCRDSKILKSVILLDVPIKEKLELQERLWSLILLWHDRENGDVRPRINSIMLRDPVVKSATGRANVASRAPPSKVFIYYSGSQSSRKVVFVTKQGRYALCIAWDYPRIDISVVFRKQE